MIAPSTLEANSAQGGAACLGSRPGSWFLASQRDMINQSLLWVAYGSLLWVAVPSTTAGKAGEVVWSQTTPMEKLSPMIV